MMRRVRLLLAFACLGAALGVRGQNIPDPTKPPAGWGPTDKAARATSEPKDTEAPVQLVLSGKTRRFAIVRGDLLGDSGKGSRVIEIRRNDVVVQTDKGRETLSLFPDVQKTPPKAQDGMGNKDQK